MSEQFGQIKRWDELTEEEKQSGDWEKLPDGIRWQKMDPLHKDFKERMDEIVTNADVSVKLRSHPMKKINRENSKVALTEATKLRGRA